MVAFLQGAGAPAPKSFSNEGRGLTRTARSGNTNAAIKAPSGGAPPWEKWRVKALDARAIKFMEEFCRPAKGHGHGKPLALANFQKEFLSAALAGEDVTSAAITMGRGAGKSTFAGGIATWMLMDPKVHEAFGGEPVIPVVATTLKRGRKGVFGAARAFCKGHPELVDRTHAYAANGAERIVSLVGAEGEISLAAANAEDLQGEDISCALLDEIGFLPVEIWDALLQSGGKRPRTLLLGVGTRSPGNTDNILDFLLGQVRQLGHIPGFVLIDHKAGDDRSPDDEEGWAEANPLIAEGKYDIQQVRERKALTHPALFECYTLNRKVASVGGWLGESGPEAWDKAVTERQFSTSEPVFLGVDKSKRGDLSAVVAVQRIVSEDADNGKWLVAAEVFYPNPTVDHKAVRDRIRWWHDNYDLRACGYDSRYFVEGAQELEEEFGEGVMLDVPQNFQRLSPVYAQLYQLVHRGDLLHHDDPVFRTHVLSAVADNNKTGAFMIKKDPQSRTHIDSAVAMAIAFSVSDVEEQPALQYFF